MTMQALVDSIKKYFGNIYLFIFLVLVIVVGITFGIYSIFHKSYVPLYTDMTKEDISLVANNLKEMKKNFQIKNGGEAIWVEEQDVDNIRVGLAGKGAASGANVGYEVFDKGDYGATDFTQKINFQRAIQGELAKAIMRMQHIDFAKVFISFPEEKLFSNSTDVVKASVIVSTKSGYTLAPLQISGIQMMVAGSVSNLKKENVTVHNQLGEIISKPENDQAEDTFNKLELKKEIEEYLTVKATSILYKAVGIGNGDVAIDVDLNFDELNKQSETVFPPESKVGAMAVYEKISESKRNDVKRMDSSSPDKSTPEVLDSESEVKYEISKSTESRISEKGRIVAITASIVITAGNYTELQLDSIKKLMATSIGLNEARGDKVEIAMFIPPVSVDNIVTTVMSDVDKAVNTDIGERGVVINGSWNELLLKYSLCFLGFLIFFFAVILLYRHISRRRALEGIRKTLESF